MHCEKELVACCFAVLSAASLAQQNFSLVEIATHRLADNLLLTLGSGRQQRRAGGHPHGLDALSSEWREHPLLPYRPHL
jgi:hypothetical protein